MKTLTSNDVFEIEPHLFTAEASSLGLKPGEWPGQLDTTLGNGQPLLRKRWREHEGDIQYVEYWQAFGCVRLRIFND